MEKRWENKKAIIYTRVSTTEQKNFGHSLDQQRELLLQFCEKNNIEVIKLFEEDYSAKNFDRPEFKKLLKFTNKVKVDLLLTYDWSRFSRNTELSFSMIRKLKSKGIEVNTISQKIDLNDPSYPIIQGIYLSQAHVDNIVRSKNTKKGNNGALRSGRFINRAPIGYYNDKGMNPTGKPMLQIDENKAFLIKEIFVKYSTGKYSQAFLRKEYNRKGLKLSKSQFSNMLSNITYIGKVYVPAFEDLPEDIVDGVHEPIIDEVTFYKAQQVKSGKANIRINSKRVSKHEEHFPLRGGILKCSKCGSNLTGSHSRSRNGNYHRYYHCKSGCSERFSVELAHQEFDNFLANLESAKKF
ncbi:recombinase family protein [Weeksellaceae bacterium TAE3-ERU29]|nr:recombinase family protein [Weeksellaceae bacterium TAE3-ERU29]